MGGVGTTFTTPMDLPKGSVSEKIKEQLEGKVSPEEVAKKIAEAAGEDSVPGGNEGIESKAVDPFTTVEHSQAGDTHERGTEEDPTGGEGAEPTEQSPAEGDGEAGSEADEEGDGLTTEELLAMFSSDESSSEPEPEPEEVSFQAYTPTQEDAEALLSGDQEQIKDVFAKLSEHVVAQIYGELGPKVMQEVSSKVAPVIVNTVYDAIPVVTAHEAAEEEFPAITERDDTGEYTFGDAFGKMITDLQAKNPAMPYKQVVRKAAATIQKVVDRSRKKKGGAKTTNVGEKADEPSVGSGAGTGGGRTGKKPNRVQRTAQGIKSQLEGRQKMANGSLGAVTFNR